MTLRETPPRHTPAAEPCEDDSVRAVPELSEVPRGWQPNPVISGEAASMCATDYKSAPRHLPRRAVGIGSVVRMPLYNVRGLSRCQVFRRTG